MRALVVVALSGCVLARTPRIDERPHWRLGSASELDRACVIARALVAKSGKQGIGIAIELSSRAACAIEFTAARLRFTDGSQLAVAPPPAQALPSSSLANVWWPIAFDNNAAWNAGRNAAELELDYVIDREPGAWQLALVQQ